MARYDTLNDVEDKIEDLTSFDDLYNFIFASSSAQNFVGALISGAVTTGRASSTWGHGRSFDSNVVYVR